MPQTAIAGIHEDSNSLVDTEGNPDTDIATADDFGGAFGVEGRNDKAGSLCRVALYNGTTEEEERYGKHDRGVFLDLLEKRELGTSILFMPVFAKASFAMWRKGARSPEATWDDENQVPAELLKWGEPTTPGGKGIPPAVQEAINVVGIVQGSQAGATVEEYPYLLVFKSTGLVAFDQTIKMMESKRRSVKKGPGMYKIYSKPGKNADGQAFLRLAADFVGEPLPEMLKIGKGVYKAKVQYDAKVKEASNSESAVHNGEFDPNAN